MTHVFISYASEDRELAREVRSRLSNAQKQGWLDSTSIIIGGDYRQEIDKAIRTAAAVVVLLTPHSVRSQYVTYEWAFALGAGVPVLPLMAKRARIHLRLEPLQCLDFTGSRRPWSQLVAHLESDRRSLSSSTPNREPTIFARFELERGQPIRQGRQYKIDVGTRNVPEGTKKVDYEILDDTFKKEPKWSVGWGQGDFEDWIFSYGDVFITAKGAGTEGPWRARATLSEALRLGYAGRRRSSQIAKAMKDIDEN